MRTLPTAGFILSPAETDPRMWDLTLRTDRAVLPEEAAMFREGVTYYIKRALAKRSMKV